jgi:hypothetical protein
MMTKDELREKVRENLAILRRTGGLEPEGILLPPDLYAVVKTEVDRRQDPFGFGIPVGVADWPNAEPGKVLFSWTMPPIRVPLHPDSGTTVDGEDSLETRMTRLLESPEPELQKMARSVLDGLWLHRNKDVEN